MNTIQKELQAAQQKMLKEVHYKDFSLAKPTADNVAMAEAMYRCDSSYRNSSDPNAAPLYGKNGQMKYGGSSAYWMTQLKRILIEESPTDYSYVEIVRGAVEAVDRENSTHLNADRCGRAEIEERILGFDRDDLIKCLKDPKYEDMKLVREIARKTSAKSRARTNVSFASKFCHYACYFIFEGTEYQDNYPIYDGVLKRVLPLYLQYFGVGESYNLNDYRQYRNAVDAIREVSGIEISRNGLDHLLWYYHKGRAL